MMRGRRHGERRAAAGLARSNAPTMTTTLLVIETGVNNGINRRRRRQNKQPSACVCVSVCGVSEMIGNDPLRITKRIGGN